MAGHDRPDVTKITSSLAAAAMLRLIPRCSEGWMFNESKVEALERSNARTGSAHVLMVDDDGAMRTVIDDYLTDHNFVVSNGGVRVRLWPSPRRGAFARRAGCLRTITDNSGKPVRSLARRRQVGALGPGSRGYRESQTLGCASCHQGVNVGANLFERHGIFAPLGSAEPRLLRVPSLRNVAITTALLP